MTDWSKRPPRIRSAEVQDKPKRQRGLDALEAVRDAELTINRDDAKRFERELLDKLGVDPSIVQSGTLRAEFTSGDSHVRVTWTGLAWVPVGEFEEFFNYSQLRPAP